MEEKYVRKHLAKALQLAAELQACPELGFSEFKSSEILRRYWEELGLEVEGPFAGTGIRARIHGAKSGPTVCLMSELDAVVSPQNPMAAKDGIAHACGHNIQSAQVYAAGAALMEMKDSLCGDVVLLAVPAEEFLEIAHRLQLRKEGRIRYLSGKPELYRLGVFKDIDMVVLIHAFPEEEARLHVGGGSLGFTAKNIRFEGVSGHGAAPFESRNALQAATLFFAGVNANRETFRDEESIRIHPIITKGGEIVNSVPDDVRIETYVRGRTREAIEKGCRIVDRCAKAAAEMMGCKAYVETIPGYLPLMQDKDLSSVAAEVGAQVLGDGNVIWGTDMVGSTDIGDLTHLMPAIQLLLGGFRGQQHGADFACIDISRTCMQGAMILTGFALKLLGDNASMARKVKDDFKRLLTDEQYFEYMDMD